MSFRDWVVFAMLAACATSACGGKSREQRGAGGDDETGGRGGNSGATGGTPASGGTSTTGGAPATGGTWESDGSVPIYLYDANNYQLTTGLSIEVVDTAPGVDLDICWTDVVTNLTCGPVDPQSDIDAIALIGFQGLSMEEIQETVGRGELDQSAISAFAQWDSDHQSTCTKLSSLSVFGSIFDIATEYVENANRNYLFIAGGSVTPGAAAQSMVFVRPVSTSMNTRVDIPPGCGIQDSSTGLGEPVHVPSNPPWMVYWNNLTRDGQGNPIQFGSLDLLRLSFFADATLTELEERIGELDRIATASWELDISGSDGASLAQARNLIDGQAFSGFQREEPGVWLLMLTCSGCFTPAPPVVVVLES